MAAPAPVSQHGPPPVPEGWAAYWSYESNAWYYMNIMTQTSQWENPFSQPQFQTPQTISPQPFAPYSSPNQEYPQSQTQYDNVGIQDPLSGPDGDRGLGKVGMGVLGVAGAVLAGTFVKHEIDEHKHHEPHFKLFGKIGSNNPTSGGFFGGMASHIPFAQNNTSPPPPNAAGGGFFTGAANLISMGSAPQLFIHCAAYSDQDVTHIVRKMVTPSQSLEINTDTLGNHFGDPWPGNRKQFSVIYSYGPRPWELFATADNCGTTTILPHQPLDKTRMEFMTNHDERSRILGVVWGTKNGLEGGKGPIEKVKEIETSGEFQATNSWMGFDGMCGPAKTAIAYYRTENGAVAFTSSREGGTCRLPWNPLAKWT